MAKYRSTRENCGFFTTTTLWLCYNTGIFRVFALLLSICMTDPYHQIYQGEIFTQSQCIVQENTMMDFFRNNLMALGYCPLNDSKKVWQRGNRTVVVCLVDDVITCSQEYSKALPYQFDKNTVVITDNRINVPTQYKVRQVPESFYGIYSHQPQQSVWKPSRRLNFSVNRIDTKRFLVMLEIYHRARLNPELATLDHINFNCWSWSGNNSSKAGLKDNFLREWDMLGNEYHAVYRQSFQELKEQMPMINHTLSHEESLVSSWINVVMETYSSDNNIALSEKIFRAMCLPVPWILYSGKHSVAYLHSMGFDVLDDIIPHSYDSMIENRTAAYGDKMVDFIFEGVDAVSRMKTQRFQTLSQRTGQAAAHNQHRLAELKAQWPRDFAQWWPAVLADLQ